MRRPPPRHAQIHLPPLSADDAVRLANLLDRVVIAIWRAHGDAMANAIAPDEPPFDECDYSSTDDDDEIPF